MDRNTALWTLVVFFGATVIFGGIRNATEDGPVGVQVGLQALAALLLLGGLVVFVRSRDR